MHYKSLPFLHVISLVTIRLGFINYVSLIVCVGIAGSTEVYADVAEKGDQMDALALLLPNMAPPATLTYTRRLSGWLVPTYACKLVFTWIV